jgi:glycolate oxidase FAD binding subunit
MLTFEPMDHRPLLGASGVPRSAVFSPATSRARGGFQPGRRATIFSACRFVNGSGEIIKSGGRVMKNVTGLDLVKLMAGSWGTLGVLCEVIFKVLPRPETAVTIVVKGLNDAKPRKPWPRRWGCRSRFRVQRICPKASSTRSPMAA